MTSAVRAPRRDCGTVPFQLKGWICLPLHYLRGLTHYSVSARLCHFSVSASLRRRVTESLLFVHRVRLAAAP